MEGETMIKEYDERGNLIYWKTNDGFEQWIEYNKNNKITHYRDAKGFESWSEYDKNNNEIHYKTERGYERWCEYDENNNLKAIKTLKDGITSVSADKEGKVIHFTNKKDYQIWH